MDCCINFSISCQSVSSADKLDSSMCLFFSSVKVGRGKYGRAHTFLHELSHWSFTGAMRGPCQLIRRGWWQLHPSPYVFFHPKDQSPVGTFPSSVKPRRTFPTAKTTVWAAETWNEIFSSNNTRWHELDLPGKVMRRYRGNREHHQYVKKGSQEGRKGGV